MVQIKVLVKTKTKETKIDYEPETGIYIIHVQSKPINNQANKEIIKLVKKFFKAEKVEILSGFKNNQKIINLINPKIQLR